MPKGTTSSDVITPLLILTRVRLQKPYNDARKKATMQMKFEFEERGASKNIFFCQLQLRHVRYSIPGVPNCKYFEKMPRFIQMFYDNINNNSGQHIDSDY